MFAFYTSRKSVAWYLCKLRMIYGEELMIIKHVNVLLKNIFLFSQIQVLGKL